MMEYKGYIGKVEYDPDAKILHGEVFGIRDVVTFQADSPKDVEREFHASVDEYLAYCAERGESPNKPFSGRFLVRVDPDLHRTLSTLAEAFDKSLNALVSEYLYREVAKTLLESRSLAHDEPDAEESTTAAPPTPTRRGGARTPLAAKRRERKVQEA